MQFFRVLVNPILHKIKAVEVFFIWRYLRTALGSIGRYITYKISNIFLDARLVLRPCFRLNGALSSNDASYTYGVDRQTRDVQ